VFRVSGFGFRDQGLGFGDEGGCFMVRDRVDVEHLGFRRVSGFGFWVWVVRHGYRALLSVEALPHSCNARSTCPTRLFSPPTLSLAPHASPSLAPLLLSPSFSLFRTRTHAHTNGSHGRVEDVKGSDHVLRQGRLLVLALRELGRVLIEVRLCNLFRV
jgi:hypothetical protein